MRSYYVFPAGPFIIIYLFFVFVASALITLGIAYVAGWAIWIASAVVWHWHHLHADFIWMWMHFT